MSGAGAAEVGHCLQRSVAEYGAICGTDAASVGHGGSICRAAGGGMRDHNGDRHLRGRRGRMLRTVSMRISRTACNYFFGVLKALSKLQPKPLILEYSAAYVTPVKSDHSLSVNLLPSYS